jgi:predicted GNAT family acetyltransferase
MFWTGEGVYSNVVDKEVDVTNAKRRRIRIVGMCIFTRSQQEEEAQDDHLADGV